MPPTNSFSIILPSNTPSDPGNRSNKFVVQLPRKLVFPGSGWVVGLTNIIYPNSWSTIDAIDPQFLYLHLKDGRRYRLPLPAGAFLSPEELERELHAGMIKLLEKKTGTTYKRPTTAAAQTPTTAKRTKRDAAPQQAPTQSGEAPVHPLSWTNLNAEDQAFANTLTEEEIRFLYAVRARYPTAPPPTLTSNELRLVKELRAKRTGGFSQEELYIIGTHPQLRKGQIAVDDVSTITVVEVNEIRGARKRRWDLRQPKPLAIIDDDKKLNVHEMKYLNERRLAKRERIRGPPFRPQERELIAKLRQVAEWRISEAELALIGERRRKRNDPMSPNLRSSISPRELHLILGQREAAEAATNQTTTPTTPSETPAQKQAREQQEEQQRLVQQRLAQQEQKTKEEQQRRVAEQRAKEEQQRILAIQKEREEQQRRVAEQQRRDNERKQREDAAVQRGTQEQRTAQQHSEAEEAVKARTHAPYSYLDMVNDHSIYSHVKWARRGRGAEKLLIYGSDPIPRAHHLMEKDGDGHLFAVTAVKFAKEQGVQRVDRDFFIKVEENIERFEELYAQAEGKEDFAHLGEQEKRQLVHLAHSVRFAWDEDLNRFVFHVFESGTGGASLLDFVTLSDQLAGVLGFESAEQWIYPNTVAKYPPDLHGGVSHLNVYLNGGVIEPMIVGDRQTHLLQMVAVSGRPGDIVERNFQAPLFQTVSAREVSRLEVEIRTTTGRLVPFSYGEVILTLQFKKTIAF